MGGLQFDAFSKACDRAVYDLRKLVYVDLKFLLKMRGKYALCKELRHGLKTIKQLIAQEKDKRYTARK
jgi:hypothetical protein